MPSANTHRILLQARALIACAGPGCQHNIESCLLLPPPCPASPPPSNILPRQTFGRASQPVKKVMFMTYWMRRLFFSNPFALPRELPATPEAWITLALRRYAGPTACVHGGLTECISDDMPPQGLLMSLRDRLAAVEYTRATAGDVGIGYFAWTPAQRAQLAHLLAYAPFATDSAFPAPCSRIPAHAFHLHLGVLGRPRRR